MRVCDVCGRTHRNQEGGNLPQAWETKNVQHVCKECWGKFLKEMQPTFKDLDEQARKAAWVMLGKMCRDINARPLPTPMDKNETSQTDGPTEVGSPREIGGC